MSQYGKDYDLVVGGAAIGIKSLRADRIKGILHSPSLDHEWRDGINEAKCSAPPHTDFAFQRVFQGTMSQAAWETAQAKARLVCAEGQCRHKWGFHTHWYRNHLYAHAPMIAHAVMEGTGQTDLGPEGFRSRKARLLAIHVPNAGPRERARYKANYPSAQVYRNGEHMDEDFKDRIGAGGLVEPKGINVMNDYYEMFPQPPLPDEVEPGSPWFTRILDVAKIPHGRPVVPDLPIL